MKDNPVQMPELLKAEVAHRNCGVALFAPDGNPHVRLLDHGHIIPAVSDGQNYSVQVFFDVFDYHGFFLRGASTEYHALHIPEYILVYLFFWLDDGGDVLPFNY